MGTNYTLSYIHADQVLNKARIDSILIEINLAVSTYIPESIISKINTDSLSDNSTGAQRVYQFARNSHFENNFLKSKEIFKDTDGFFDPSIMPLVNYWGFGYKDKKAVQDIDSAKVTQLSLLCDFAKWKLSHDSTTTTITKPSRSELDFSAIAKGYAVDFLRDYFKELGLENFMIEIGGEIYCCGNNGRGNSWRIGLSKPEIAASVRDIHSVIELSDMAMASSGNYRNYYDINGHIYGHEINPKTGYPEINELLGVTVISQDCATADALATAFMVMGKQRTLSWLSNNPDTEAVLFFRNDQNEIAHYPTNGIQNRLQENQNN